MENNKRSDKQILVDWYYQMIADQLGPGVEIGVRTDETVEQDGQYLVEKRLDFVGR